MTSADRFSHFLDAQEPVYPDVLAELAAGRKASHWMWFIFPQIRGLGTSAMNRRFALDSVEDAKAYLGHPVLGRRLLDCCGLLLSLEGNTATDIFGPVDAMKLHSSMTLFALAAPDCETFTLVLDKYFRGQQDTATLALVGQA